MVDIVVLHARPDALHIEALKELLSGHSLAVEEVVPGISRPLEAGQAVPVALWTAQTASVGMITEEFALALRTFGRRGVLIVEPGTVPPAAILGAVSSAVQPTGDPVSDQAELQRALLATRKTSTITPAVGGMVSYGQANEGSSGAVIGMAAAVVLLVAGGFAAFQFFGRNGDAGPATSAVVPAAAMVSGDLQGSVAAETATAADAPAQPVVDLSSGAGAAARAAQSQNPLPAAATPGGPEGTRSAAPLASDLEVIGSSAPPLQTRRDVEFAVSPPIAEPVFVEPPPPAPVQEAPAPSAAPAATPDLEAPSSVADATPTGP
jgi:hypothetical protein